MRFLIQQINNVFKAPWHITYHSLQYDYRLFASISVWVIVFRRPTEMKLNLTDKSSKNKLKYMGYLLLQVTLLPKTQDEKEQVRNSRTSQ